MDEEATNVCRTSYTSITHLGCSNDFHVCRKNINSLEVFVFFAITCWNMLCFRNQEHPFRLWKCFSTVVSKVSNAFFCPGQFYWWHCLSRSYDWIHLFSFMKIINYSHLFFSFVCVYVCAASWCNRCNESKIQFEIARNWVQPKQNHIFFLGFNKCISSVYNILKIT